MYESPNKKSKNRMRILIVSVFFPPLNSIASLRPYSWAKYWTQAGHDVTVLTTTKKAEQNLDLHLPNPGYHLLEVSPPRFLDALKSNYHQSRQQQVAGKKLSAAGRIKQWLMKVYHYLRYKKGVFNASRMPDFMDLWIGPAVRAAKQEEPWDLVVSSAGPYAVHYVASKLKKRGLARAWIADFRDLWTDNHIYPGLFPFNRLEGLLEKRVLRNADAITVVTEPWVQNLAKRHGSERVHVVENGFDPEDLIHLPATAAFPADGKYRIVHTGSVHEGKQCPHLLIEAVSRLDKDTTQQLEVIFAGPQLKHVEELIRKYQVEHCVKTQGFVQRDQALAMQRDAHAVLFFPWSDPTGSGGGLMSGKIYEYLYSGTPILAVGGRQDQTTLQFIQKTGAGVALNQVDQIMAYLKANVAQGAKTPSRVDPAVLHQFNRKTLALKLLGFSMEEEV